MFKLMVRMTLPFSQILCPNTQIVIFRWCEDTHTSSYAHLSFAKSCNRSSKTQIMCRLSLPLISSGPLYSEHPHEALKNNQILIPHSKFKPNSLLDVDQHYICPFHTNSIEKKCCRVIMLQLILKNPYNLHIMHSYTQIKSILVQDFLCTHV